MQPVYGFIVMRKRSPHHCNKTFAQDENLEWRKQTNRANKCQASNQTKPNHFRANTPGNCNQYIMTSFGGRGSTGDLPTPIPCMMSHFTFFLATSSKILGGQRTCTTSAVEHDDNYKTLLWWRSGGVGRWRNSANSGQSNQIFGFEGTVREDLFKEEEDVLLGQMSSGGAWAEILIVSCHEIMMEAV